MAAEYTTLQGDTFDAIAYRLWGDEHLAHLLMTANPDFMDMLTFAPGVRLAVPDYATGPQEADLPPWYGGADA